MTRRTSSSVLAIGLLLLALAACGGSDDKSSDTPVSQTTPSPTLTGSTATDGICAVTIPDDWIDDGTGRGDTSNGDDWSLFGGAAETDEAWTAAKDLLKAQFDGQEGVEIVDSDSAVTVTLPNGGGLYVRERFDSRYCEFSVTSTRDNGEEVTAVWRSVADTLAVPAAE